METLNADLMPLEGGHSGETFLATGPDAPTVVRLYTGAGRRSGTDAANIDAELLQWMQGLLPVPQVLEVRRPDPALGLPAILVTSYLPGMRADRVLPSLRGAQLECAARSIAQVLQRLSMVRTPRPGQFETTGLGLGAPSEAWRDLEGYLEAVGPRLMKGWSKAERLALRSEAARAQELLDGDTVSCLVHGDFQPSNLLLDPARLEVVGVVDWEHAMSGNRFTDLGRMLRASPDPVFENALLKALDDMDGAVGLEPVAQRHAKARAADLVAMVEWASADGGHPGHAEARRLLRQRV